MLNGVCHVNRTKRDKASYVKGQLIENTYLETIIEKMPVDMNLINSTKSKL